MPTPTRRRRVFLLGLDGATLTLLRPWADEGYLPTFARLVAGGAWGTLRSTIPPVTPVAWTSMVTGVYPGKHGIFGFFGQQSSSYVPHVVSSRARRRPAIWNLLDRAGLQSIVVDVPYTYPPDAIDGIMVAGMGTPDTASEFVHPAHFRSLILRAFGPYPLDVYYRGDLLALLDDARRLSEHRLALARFLAREFPWDFFMLALVAPDRVQHVVWKFIDPQHPQYDPEQALRFWPAIIGYYQHLDGIIGHLLADLDSETALLIVSDHGFGPMEERSRLSLSRWLQGSGLLVLGGECWPCAPPDQIPEFSVQGPGQVSRSTDAGGAGRALTFEVDRPESFAAAVFQVPDLDPLRRYELKATVADATRGAMLELGEITPEGRRIIGGRVLEGVPCEVRAVFHPRAREVELFICMTTYGGHTAGRITVSATALRALEDWARTRAYLMDTGEAPGGRRIRLNVRGREPRGIVAKGQEYERLRDEIAVALLALRDDAGRPLVRRVARGEELYPGPYADEGPDLMVFFAGSTDEGTRGRTADRQPADVLTEIRPARGYSGDHHPDGLFLAYGDAVAAGTSLSARIVDICPTVLRLLDLPVPADLDGRVLTEILVPGSGEPVTIVPADA